MPCGQKGCYYPESSRNLMWCMYVNYWRYRCLKPQGVDIIPPPAPAPAEGPEEQIGAPVRIPAGPGTDTSNEYQEPEDQQPEDQQPEDQQPEDQQPEDQQPEDQQPEDQQPEETSAEAHADDSASVPDGEAGAQGEEETQVTESNAPEPVKEYQTSFVI